MGKGEFKTILNTNKLNIIHATDINTITNITTSLNDQYEKLTIFNEIYIKLNELAKVKHEFEEYAIGEIQTIIDHYQETPVDNLKEFLSKLIPSIDKYSKTSESIPSGSRPISPEERPYTPDEDWEEEGEDPESSDESGPPHP